MVLRGSGSSRGRACRRHRRRARDCGPSTASSGRFAATVAGGDAGSASRCGTAALAADHVNSAETQQGYHAAQKGPLVFVEWARCFTRRAQTASRTAVGTGLRASHSATLTALLVFAGQHAGAGDGKAQGFAGLNFGGDLHISAAVVRHVLET